MFVLRNSPNSPFGRKVRIAASVLGLADRITTVPNMPSDPADPLRQQNPLGKIPCLVLEDGSSIFDSSVILEFLQEQAGGEALLPRAGLERYRKMTLSRMADGIADAAVLMGYEARHHEGDKISTTWLDNQHGKIVRSLDAFEADPPGDALDLVAICLICAIGYLDFRKPVDWRDGHPRLAAWLDRMAALHKIVGETAPSA